MSFRRHGNSNSYQGSPNIYSGRENGIKIKVSLTIVTVFLVCHLPRIFSDVQEIVCNIQLSLDDAKRAKVSFCGNIKQNYLGSKKKFIYYSVGWNIGQSPILQGTVSFTSILQ